MFYNKLFCFLGYRNALFEIGSSKFDRYTIEIDLIPFKTSFLRKKILIRAQTNSYCTTFALQKFRLQNGLCKIPLNGENGVNLRNFHIHFTKFVSVRFESASNCTSTFVRSQKKCVYLNELGEMKAIVSMNSRLQSH